MDAFFARIANLYVFILHTEIAEDAMLTETGPVKSHTRDKLRQKLIPYDNKGRKGKGYRTDTRYPAGGLGQHVKKMPESPMSPQMFCSKDAVVRKLVFVII